MKPWHSYFLILLIIAVVVVVGYRFEQYYIARDYVVNVFTECDSTTHSCFIADQATADPAFQTGPYEKVTITAHDVPSCLEEHTCTNFSCDGIQSCTITYCSSDVLEDGESCTTIPTTTPAVGTSTEATTSP